jgi:hypothetical protein
MRSMSSICILSKLFFSMLVICVLFLIVESTSSVVEETKNDIEEDEAME